MINQIDIENEISRLRNLKQNKDRSEGELRKVALSKLQSKVFNISNRFISPEEKKEADKLFGQYLENYGFEDFTEIEKVGDLIYAKILKNRIEAQMNDFASNGNRIPHKDITAQYTSLLDQITKMEKDLGLFNKDKSEDELTGLQKLRKFFEILINFHKNEFSCTCSHCGKLLLLRRRTKDFDTLKHPFFSGRFYYNYRGMDLVKKEIWTKEQYAYAFFTSPRYVEWCLEHEHDIIDGNNVPNEKMETYIKNCDYLPDVELKKGKVRKAKKQNKKFKE